VVFFDEPMSGLDPLGRREIRDLILRLRDRGSTVFFSSHVLADAEALCSRVAVLTSGRLAAVGQLTDLVAFEVRGWELVVAGVTETTLAHARSLHPSIRATALGDQRYALELPLSLAADRVLSELTARGARLVSLNPLRETLEDFFLRQVSAVPQDRGLEIA
jgi:ABC-2 type transport system ATP-binding protein